MQEPGVSVIGLVFIRNILAKLGLKGITLIQLLKKWLSKTDSPDHSAKDPQNLNNPIQSESSDKKTNSPPPPYPKHYESEPVLDTTEALQRFANREDLFHEALKQTIEKYQNVTDQLQTMLTEDKAEDGRFLSHSLRGVMGNIGAKRIFALLSDLEEAFSENRKQEASDMITALGPMMEDFGRHVQDVIHPGKTPQTGNPSYSREQLEGFTQLLELLNKRRPSDCKKMTEILESMKNTDINGLDIDKVITFIEGYEFDRAIDIIRPYMSTDERS